MESGRSCTNCKKILLLVIMWCFTSTAPCLIYNLLWSWPWVTLKEARHTFPRATRKRHLSSKSCILWRGTAAFICIGGHVAYAASMSIYTRLQTGGVSLYCFKGSSSDWLPSWKWLTHLRNVWYRKHASDDNKWYCHMYQAFVNKSQKGALARSKQFSSSFRNVLCKCTLLQYFIHQ
jgi:hypothetical protein